MIKEIKKYIGVFQKQIQTFNALLKVNFGLQSYPTYNDAGNLFPRKGELRDGSFVYKYQFHGKGYTIMKNELVIILIY